MPLPLILPSGTPLPDPAAPDAPRRAFRLDPPRDAEAFVLDTVGGVPAYVSLRPNRDPARLTQAATVTAATNAAVEAVAPAAPEP